MKLTNCKITHLTNLVRKTGDDGLERCYLTFDLEVPVNPDAAVSPIDIFNCLARNSVAEQIARQAEQNNWVYPERVDAFVDFTVREYSDKNGIRRRMNNAYCWAVMAATPATTLVADQSTPIH